MPVELLPCPFCGSAPLFNPEPIAGGDYLMCSNNLCDAHMYRAREIIDQPPSTDVFAERWNRRTIKEPA
jgi:hypothetical protein